MIMDNLCNEGPHGLLHQLGDRLRKSLRAVGVKSGDYRVEYTDIGGGVRHNSGLDRETSNTYSRQTKSLGDRASFWT